MHEKRQEISTLVAPAAAAVGSLVAADSVYQIPLDIVRCTAEPRQGPLQRCGASLSVSPLLILFPVIYVCADCLECTLRLKKRHPFYICDNFVSHPICFVLGS